MKVAILYSHPSHEALIRAFSDLNCNVFPFFYGLHISSYIQRGYYLCFNKQKLIIDRFNNHLQKCIKSADKFDLIVVFKGHKLSKATIYQLSSNTTPIIQWTTDSIERESGQNDLLRFTVKTFFQDGKDVKLQVKGEWLPLGYDSNIFSYTEKKEIDILLLGNLTTPQYETRLEYIKEAAKLGKQGYNVVFAGANASEDLKTHFKINNVKYMGRLLFKEYAAIIKKSKVCVNIHQDDGGETINPLFFAIPAVGGLQVTDQRDYYNKWMQKGKTFFPIKLEYLNENLIHLLSTNQEIDLETSIEIRELHSYKARALRILNSDL